MSRIIPDMQRRPFATISIAFLLALALIPGCRQKGAGEKMNVLVITIDTLRADHVGFFGDARAQTPVLDRLAGSGIVFRNCYTSVPLTLPSHSSIFTGRLPIAHGVRNNGFYRLGDDELTLARFLKGKGYHTAAMIASFVLLGKFGLNNGFDVYDDSLRSDEVASDFKSEITADRVREKLGLFLASGPPTPFFLWVHMYDPHKPYTPPLEYAKRFPKDFYRGEIAFTDSVVGKMLQDLDDKGLTENTLVVIAGDHGEAFGEHKEFGHGLFCYEEDLKVPLIFFNARLFKRPLAVSQRARLIDVMPTILDLLDMPVPEQVQGLTLEPLLKGKREKTPRDVYIETMYGKEENNWAPLTGIITGPYKYISLPKAELYDLEKDRKERENIFLKKNVLARKIDDQLGEFIRTHSHAGAARRLELSGSEKKQLQALGYISTFSSAGNRSLDPKDGILLSNRLEELGKKMAKGNAGESVQRELEAMIRDPELQLPPVYHMLTTIYRKKKDRGAMQSLLQRALVVFKGTLMVNPFRLRLARLYMDANKLELARPLAELVYQDDPANVMTLVLMGEIAERDKDTAKAIRAYLLAEKQEPNNYALKKKLVELYLKDRQIAEALAVYRRMLASTGIQRDPELLFTISTLTAQGGDLAEAESLLREAIAKKEDGRYLFHLALILAKKGDGEAALSALETAMDKHAQDLSEEQRQTARKLLAVN
jgi:arylsulfatase A-like enzyme/predicted negative regulator of RcsB-dependent stress response